MALPIPTTPLTAPSGGGAATVTSDQFNDLIKIQTSALKSLVAIEGALVKSASALAEERLEKLAAGSDAAVGGKKGGGIGGLLGKGGGLLKGLGAAGLGAGLGIGAVLAGAGIAAGGVSLLLNTLAEPGLGENIRKNVDELLAINEGNAKTLAAVNFLAVFTALGAGLMVFGVGKLFNALPDIIYTFNQKMGGKPFAEGVKDDIETLLSIKTGGALNIISITAAMGFISAGLIAFGIGQTLASVGTIAKALAEKAEGSDKTVAELIKADLETLMSIQIPPGGMAEIKDISKSMGFLGAGLAAFGAGTTIASIGQIASELAKKLGGSEKSVAEMVVADMEALMGIKLPVGGMGEIKDISKSMGFLSAGLAAFGAGVTIASIGQIASELAAKLGGSEKSVAEMVVSDMEALMGIKLPAGGMAEIKDISKSMGFLSAGLAAFGAGTTIASIGQIASELAAKLGDSDKSVAEMVVSDMEALMGIKIPEGGMAEIKDISKSMGFLSAGLAAFGAGTTIASIGQIASELAKKMGEGDKSVAEMVVADMEALMNIKLPAGGMGEIKDITKSMGFLSAGLTAFGAGTAIASIGQLASTLASKFGDSDKSVAEMVVADMEALMNIKIPEGGMKKIGDIEQSMKNLSKGMMAFSVGQTIATIGSVASTLAGKLEGGDKSVAEMIASDMEALMGIKIPEGGMQKVEDVEQSMKNMAKGMAAFGAGIGIASIGNIVETLAKKVGGTEKTIAEQIKEDIELLTSIKVTTQDTSTFEDQMGNIAKGLAKFAGGKALVSIGDLISAFSQKIGNDPWATAITTDVNNLLGIVGDDSEVNLQKGKDFVSIMGYIAEGLGKFTGSTFIANLGQAFGAVTQWLSGESSPVMQAIKLAESAEQLERVGAGLDSAARGLQVFSQVKKMADLELEEFAKDLSKSVPVIEMAVMGGAISSGWSDWGNNNIKFEGLANPKINFEDAARNMQALHSAFTGTFTGMTAKGAVDPGSQVGQGVIDSMIIRTAIIESVTIQGPIAGAIGPTPGGGATINNNTVTVAPTTNSSVSSVTRTENTYGTTDPFTAIPSAF